MVQKIIIDGVLQGVSAIVFNNRAEVLMLHRSGTGESYQSGWEFIKGGLHVGESHLEAALREIREEAGPIEIEFVAELSRAYLADVRYRKKEYGWVEKKSLVFFCRSGEVSLSKEHSQHAWMSLSEACEVCWVEYGAEILREAYRTFEQWQTAHE